MQSCTDFVKLLPVHDHNQELTCRYAALWNKQVKYTPQARIRSLLLDKLQEKFSQQQG